MSVPDSLSNASGSTSQQQFRWRHIRKDIDIVSAYKAPFYLNAVAFGGGRDEEGKEQETSKRRTHEARKEMAAESEPLLYKAVN